MLEAQAHFEKNVWSCQTRFGCDRRGSELDQHAEKRAGSRASRCTIGLAAGPRSERGWLLPATLLGLRL